MISTIVIVGWMAVGAPDPPERLEAAETFWAFEAPRPQLLPAVADRGWPRGRVDAFVLGALEDADLRPAPGAERRALIRRVTLDLIGLPPDPDDVEEFVADRSPTAYEDLVARLLASPHRGERRARMWLDLARYAEDQAHIVGDNKSLFYPNAFRYRDWVIDALNADLPYDDFIRLQLAADLLESDDREDDVALGFIGLGPKYYDRGNPMVKADEWEDRVDTVTRGLLGLTVACARCHDHKYDPISTADYYALAGVFASTEMFNRPLDGKSEEKKDGQAKNPQDSIHIVREGKPVDLNVLVRGDVNQKGPVVERRFLTVLGRDEPSKFEEGSGRRELAEAIVDCDNPLTARVLVNRIWTALVGTPLVGTPSNFGSLGDRPTNQALLDDLAVRFMDSGWSIKWLEREIVLSAAYRQSSRAEERTVTADPDNRLLGRMNRKRLDIEAWRDTLLAVSGHLETTIGGRSIDVRDPDCGRRTVYSEVSRFRLDPMLALFDFPDPNVHAAKRVETTTPLQKLFVLNSPLVARHTELLAGRLVGVETAPGEDVVVARIELAYSLLYSRPPSAAELELGREFVTAAGTPGDAIVWRQYAQVLLASNELFFID